mmetsp:Transcript_16300/g.27619  ORF Transcript_16300/g.27619 Transcript_16300/m.27619 type:complete len:243 (+) Transcript_16300:393-1121(+)
MLFVHVGGKLKEAVLGEVADQIFDFIGFILDGAFLLTSEQFLPGMMTFVNDGHGISLVHEPFLQSKHIRGLAIGNLVRPVPFPNRVQRSWQLFLDIVNVVQERSPFVIGVNDNDLPITLAFINHAQNSKNLDGTNTSWLNNTGSNFADIEWVVVTSGTFSIGMDKGGVLPRLGEAAIVEEDVSLLELTQLTLLGILFDGVPNLTGGNLVLFSAEFGDFADKVEEGCFLFGLGVNVGEVNVMP